MICCCCCSLVSNCAAAATAARVKRSDHCASSQSTSCSHSTPFVRLRRRGARAERRKRRGARGHEWGTSGGGGNKRGTSEPQRHSSAHTAAAAVVCSNTGRGCHISPSAHSTNAAQLTLLRVCASARSPSSLAQRAMSDASDEQKGAGGGASSSEQTADSHSKSPADHLQQQQQNEDALMQEDDSFSTPAATAAIARQAATVAFRRAGSGRKRKPSALALESQESQESVEPPRPARRGAWTAEGSSTGGKQRKGARAAAAAAAVGSLLDGEDASLFGPAAALAAAVASSVPSASGDSSAVLGTVVAGSARADPTVTLTPLAAPAAAAAPAAPTPRNSAPVPHALILYTDVTAQCCAAYLAPVAAISAEDSQVNEGPANTATIASPSCLACRSSSSHVSFAASPFVYAPVC